ncbi:MAG: hypothetical protein PWP27_54 [Clostridiales bacterium]|jgi:spore germination protein YaaH|nr:hypothetical protein [Clostridiales bacterium]MDK2932244.1 hypothetical protein [Clostridiales bacterium]
MKKYLMMFIIIILMTSSTINVFAQAESVEKFTDIPPGDWSEQYIYKLKELNITKGKGNDLFGYNDYITRAEFLTFLIRILNIDVNNQRIQEIFTDISATDWYYKSIIAGLQNSIIFRTEYPENKFEPNKYITREEMAVMIVRALQYDELAKLLNKEQTPFRDVKNYKGYITVAKDLGIIYGKSVDAFAPGQNALRQEAAAMLVRLYNILNHKLQSLNGFYAIRSYPQIDKMNVFNMMSFGWSRIEFNEQSGQIELSISLPASNHPFYIPDGFSKVIEQAEKNNIKKYMMVFGTNQDRIMINEENIGLISLLLNNKKNSSYVIEDIVNLVNKTQKDNISVEFDGVVIDFEALMDSGDDRNNFISFLSQLKQELDKAKKELMVCVHPKREPGQVFFDGYDYKAIGEIADKVILMAHDYDPKKLNEEEKESFAGNIPSLAPIKDIYYALRYAIDPKEGIPKKKLLLQINFDAIQWEFKDGNVIDDAPKHLLYEKVGQYMEDSSLKDRQMKFSSSTQLPYLVFEDENSKKFIWYEDERSIKAKMKIAQMFGIDGISVWRLGLVPDFTDLEDQIHPHYLNVWPLFESITSER